MSISYLLLIFKLLIRIVTIPHSGVESLLQRIQQPPPRRTGQIPSQMERWQQQRPQQSGTRRPWRPPEALPQEGRVVDLPSVPSVSISGKGTVVDTDNLKHRIDNFQAGAVSRCLDKWEKITTDQWILRLIEGYEIDFVAEPYQNFRPRPLRLDAGTESKLQQALVEYLDLGIIEPCPEEEDGFYSNLFTVPKRDESVRVIFNLSDLNWFIDTDHFKMDTVKQAIELMTDNCFFGSIDFKHAYYSVRISRQYRKYLRFYWNGKTYQFTVMAQGLCTAPRDYTKMLKPAFAFLRNKGFTVLGYIDDTIFIEEDKNFLVQALRAATHLFDELGLTISIPKSVLMPVQRIEYPGFNLDSTNMSVTLTDKKKQKIWKMANKLIKCEKFLIRDLAAFIGNVVAAETGVWMAGLHYKPLEIERNKALKLNAGNFDATMFMNTTISIELQWWIDTILDSIKYITPPDIDLTLFSDASNKGWGGHIENGASTGGDWSATEMKDHINVLELKAAFLTLQSFCSAMSNVYIKLMLDNTTAIACINKFGSVKPLLMAHTQCLYSWVLQRNIRLIAGHVPGKKNVRADKESRTHNYDIEWSLKKKWFDWIVKQFGRPDIDLFASRINKQLDTYAAWRPDPHAKYIDAFSISWSNIYGYLFPPFSVMSRVVRKLEADRATAILLFPEWTTQPWLPRLRRLIVGEPILLPWDALILPQCPGESHPLKAKLNLRAVKVSAKPMLRPLNN